MAIENHGPQIQAVAILFLTLAWVAVTLRCSVRLFMTQLFRIDDWLALLTLGVFTMFCAFVLAGEKTGTGRRFADIPPEDIQISMKLWYCGELTYVTTTCLLKVYIGAFLLQICVVRSQVLVIWTVIISFSVFSIYFLLLMTFQCHPISYFWTRFGVPVGPPGTCISPTIIVDSTYTHGVLSALADWTLGTMPIFLVWNLQMNTRTKVSVALILALGAVGSVATVIRIFYIHKLSHTSEFLFDNTETSIWSTVEPGMGITASSMACLRPLFRSCLSHSRYLTSNPTTTSAWNATPVRVRSSNGLNQLHLHEIPPKAIRVTTVIDAHSSRESRDLEAAIGPTEERSNPPSMYRGEVGWNESPTGDTSDENGRSPASEGSKVVCTAGAP